MDLDRATRARGNGLAVRRRALTVRRGVVDMSRDVVVDLVMRDRKADGNRGADRTDADAHRRSADRGMDGRIRIVGPDLYAIRQDSLAAYAVLAGIRAVDIGMDVRYDQVGGAAASAGEPNAREPAR